MKRFLFAAILMVLICGVAAGQDFPKVELFGGYSVMRLGISESDIRDIPEATTIDTKISKFMMKGFNVSGAFNVTPSFGIVADFRYNQDNVAEFTADVLGFPVSGRMKFRDISILAGPRFTMRKNERVTPFVHALAGLDSNYAKVDGEVDIEGEIVTISDSDTSSGFGLAVGGGLDVNVNQSLAIRLIQADYYLTRHSGEQRNNMNLAFGLVFHFGK